VGTVWLATSLRGEVVSRRSLFPGTRHEIRSRAAQAALLLLYRRLTP
jgi:nicotinamide mononucleotide (NMN) deamidase PncC